MYFIFGAFAGVLGTMMSIYIRMELSYPSVQILAENNQLYNVLVTAHVFLMNLFTISMYTSTYGDSAAYRNYNPLFLSGALPMEFVKCQNFKCLLLVI